MKEDTKFTCKMMLFFIIFTTLVLFLLYQAEVNAVDSPAFGAYCGSIICADLDWSLTVDEMDFLIIIGSYGYGATGDMDCLDGVFSSDGYADMYDIASWDWMLTEDRGNYCNIPLIGAGMSMDAMSAGADPYPDSFDLSDLLIIGKRGTIEDSNKLKDCLYIFDSNGLYKSFSTPVFERCNIGLVRGNEPYQVNTEIGILNIAGEVIISPGEVGGLIEPRYGTPAMVYIGIQEAGEDSWGRPIFDAAFDANYVYIVPVVVDPNTEEPYTAIAKLLLTETSYGVIQLYDNITGMPREVEVDGNGNLYVLSVNSDSLQIYDTNTTEITEHINLDYLPDPIGMHLSESDNRLYLASAQRNPNDVNSSVVYDFNTIGNLTLERLIAINGLHHITDITGDSTGIIWVIGFNMDDITGGLLPNQEPFYHPYLAQISPDSDIPDYVICLSDANDLALPISIIWTGDKCGGADLDKSGNINFGDFTIFADGNDVSGLSFIIEYWLEENCE